LIIFEGILGGMIIAAFVYNYFKNKIPWSKFKLEKSKQAGG
jgi:hypothetical protein